MTGTVWYLLSCPAPLTGLRHGMGGEDVVSVVAAVVASPPELCVAARRDGSGGVGQWSSVGAARTQGS